MLDTTSSKRGRGRPAKVVPSAIHGRAENYRGILASVWDRLSPPLLKAQNEEDVVKAFQEGHPYEREFIQAGLAPVFVQVLRDKNFPKRRQTQINFLADSLASLGLVSPRRSRDICAEQRLIAKRAHHIIRYEFYVECSCGYSGHSEDHACPKCNARVPFETDLFGWG
jgi:hypothetical protein